MRRSPKSLIKDALVSYEVRIEGYFSEVVLAVDEADARLQVMSGLPFDFVVDQQMAWKVSPIARIPKHGKHEKKGADDDPGTPD